MIWLLILDKNGQVRRQGTHAVDVKKADVGSVQKVYVTWQGGTREIFALLDGERVFTLSDKYYARKMSFEEWKRAIQVGHYNFN